MPITFTIPVDWAPKFNMLPEDKVLSLLLGAILHSRPLTNKNHDLNQLVTLSRILKFKWVHKVNSYTILININKIQFQIAKIIINWALVIKICTVNQIVCWRRNCVTINREINYSGKIYLEGTITWNKLAIIVCEISNIVILISIISNGSL